MNTVYPRVTSIHTCTQMQWINWLTCICLVIKLDAVWITIGTRIWSKSNIVWPSFACLVTALAYRRLLLKRNDYTGQGGGENPELDQIEQRRMELTSADRTLDSCFPVFVPRKMEQDGNCTKRKLGLSLSLSMSLCLLWFPNFGDSLDFF